MIPSSFQYQKAASVDEAINLLSEGGEDAKILAGGHSLIPTMRLRLNSPTHLIDIAKIPTLNFIRDEGEKIVIGATTTHSAIANSQVLQTKVPMMAEAAGMIGDVQVRNVGTIGGSIAHADPAADWPAVLLAANASISMKGKGGERSVAAKNFFLGLFMTALQEDEIITEIHVPATGAASTYQKFVQPASRFAIVGCACSIERDGDRCRNAYIAFAGVSAKPYRDGAVEFGLNGHQLTKENIESAANLAAENVSIMSDHFASEPYRKHLAKVYAKRAIMAAVFATPTAVAAMEGSPDNDDLTKIEGVGPKIAEILIGAGIHSFAQLAQSSPDRIREILAAAGTRYASHNPGTWPEQARLAAAGEWDKLKKWQDELDGGV